MRVLLAILMTSLLVWLSAEASMKSRGEKWLAEVENRPGVHKIKSGLMFKYVVKSEVLEPMLANNDENRDKVSPKDKDEVEIHYETFLMDGTKVDSSRDRKRPAVFKPSQMMNGWTEALQLMREGDTVEFYFPYELMYGEHGSPPKIPGFAPLKCEIELLRYKGYKGRTAHELVDRLERKTGLKWEEL